MKGNAKKYRRVYAHALFVSEKMRIYKQHD